VTGRSGNSSGLVPYRRKVPANVNIRCLTREMGYLLSRSVKGLSFSPMTNMTSLTGSVPEFVPL